MTNKANKSTTDMKHPCKSEIVIIHDTHFSSHSLLLFKKEGHVLSLSKSSPLLYRQCAKMGYEIKNVDVVHVFRQWIDEYMENAHYVKCADRLLRKYDMGISVLDAKSIYKGGAK